MKRSRCPRNGKHRILCSRTAAYSNSTLSWFRRNDDIATTVAAFLAAFAAAFFATYLAMRLGNPEGAYPIAKSVVGATVVGGLVAGITWENL